jgi:5-methyltetrahydropteroyltriglutamate--homocysteine methyltransferase
MNVHVNSLTRDKPPFRAEHIGSLLRPAVLLEQRARFARGEISQNDLTAIAEISHGKIKSVPTSASDFGLLMQNHVQ